MLLLHDVWAWLNSPELGRDKLALLVLTAVSMYVLAAHLAWRLRLDRNWLGRLATQLARFVYYCGIPGVALLRGATVAQMGIPTTYAGSDILDLAFRLFGLAQAGELLYLGSGLAMGAAALCLLVAVWVWYARAVPQAGIGPMPWWVALREAVYMQLHWAFYRGAVATLTDDRTIIAFASLGLVAFSWVLSSQRRHDLLTPRGYLVVQDWMCALLTTFVLLSIQALWLLILFHSLWLWVGGRALARFAAQAERGRLSFQRRDQPLRIEE